MFDDIFSPFDDVFNVLGNFSRPFGESKRGYVAKDKKTNNDILIFNAVGVDKGDLKVSKIGHRLHIAGKTVDEDTGLDSEIDYYSNIGNSDVKGWKDKAGYVYVYLKPAKPVKPLEDEVKELE